MHAKLTVETVLKLSLVTQQGGITDSAETGELPAPSRSPCSDGVPLVEQSRNEEILFCGPKSTTPTRIRLRVFERVKGPSIVLLSESPDNVGLSLAEVEEGVPQRDGHAVPSSLIGLPAVAQEYCRSFWEGFLVLLESPAAHSVSRESCGESFGESEFRVRYWLGEGAAFPAVLSRAEVQALIFPAPFGGRHATPGTAGAGALGISGIRGHLAKSPELFLRTQCVAPTELIGLIDLVI